jgi:signal transduction histidine kinase
VRLHYRLVIPFAVIAVLATLGSAIVALTAFSREFESRIQSQLANISETISRSGFAFNPAILRSVKAITGADVITFDAQGAIISTTVDPVRTDLFEAVKTSPLADRARTAIGRDFVEALACDVPCYVSYRAIVDRPGVVAAVVLESRESAAAVSVMSRTILLAALTSLLALIIVSQLVARRVTAPLEDLVRFTHDVAGGVRGRARESGDEVGRLGRAFNDMFDRLDASRSALVRSEKLGLAGLMAARIAHDIRNPLASMKINTQLLEKSVGHRDPGTGPSTSSVPPRAESRGVIRNSEADLVNAVLHDIAQIETVIRDLIELARPGEVTLVSADLNAVIRTVIKPLDGRMRHRKVNAQLVLADSLPLVKIDTERFGQALLNLIVNAIDAMPTGGDLTIATSTDGSRVIADIDDDGVGIDPAMLDRVFDPFVSTKPEGVGLGLVNAKAVIEGHGGQIELSARQPRGTRARIVLPAA